MSGLSWLKQLAMFFLRKTLLGLKCTIFISWVIEKKYVENHLFADAI